jgi:hypothetical protein
VAADLFEFRERFGIVGTRKPLLSPNRGAELVFGNFAIGTAKRIGASVAKEFLFSKFTRRGGHLK